MSFLVSALAATREQAKTATNKVICFMDNIVTVWSGRQLMQSFCRKRKSKSKNPADYNPLFFLSSLWAPIFFQTAHNQPGIPTSTLKGPFIWWRWAYRLPCGFWRLRFSLPFSLSLFFFLSLSLFSEINVEESTSNHLILSAQAIFFFLLSSFFFFFLFCHKSKKKLRICIAKSTLSLFLFSSFIFLF